MAVSQYYNLRSFIATLIASFAIFGFCGSAVCAENYSSPTEANTLSGFSISSPDTPRKDTKTTDVFNNIANKISFSVKRERRDAKTSLCTIQQCNCTKKITSWGIECTFIEYQTTFGPKYYIPPEITSVFIKLGLKSRLMIAPDFFGNNSVNSIKIEGLTDENEAHVEIISNAFEHNRAPFPEILIYNCHTLILHGNAIKGEFKLTVGNCKQVDIFSNAFYDTQCSVNLTEIEQLTIDKGAFSKSYAEINIYRSNIENIYPFDAIHIQQIGFYRCKIGNVTGRTFDVLRINVIIFDNCTIATINTNAITEKLQSDQLKITGGSIGVIESQAIYGTGITEVIFYNNHIKTIQTNAIQVTAINVSITKNRIMKTELAWIHIKDWENVNISNNTIGIFDLMILDKTSNKKTASCIFEKNLITQAVPSSLNFTNPLCMIHEVILNENCSCRNEWQEKLSSHDLRSEIYCNLNMDFRFCLNITIINILKYQNLICNPLSDVLNCLESRGLKKFDGEFIKPEELESEHNNDLHYIIGISAILGIIILASIITGIICIRRRRLRDIHTIDENPDHYSDGSKTFSIEDRRIINRTLQAVKQKYSYETYKELEEHVQILYKRNINETELVQAIGRIVEILNTCENSGDSFVAFTAILGKLLRPNGDLDPIYAEPNLVDFNGHNNRNDLPEGQTDVEHIYMEPNSVQQPLLNNEYASPADRHDSTVFYSEPIGSDRDHRNIPAYAAVTPKQSINNSNTNRFIQQPSTSKNLPDVLNSSPYNNNNNKQQMTNVQKLAQTFANDPNFHITQSPNSKRRIPLYTIPNTKVKKSGEQELPRPDRSPTSLDSRSNHSGSSDITVKIDDIDYADA